MIEFVVCMTGFSIISIALYWLFNASMVSITWLDTKLNPEPEPKPEIERFTIQGALYLKQGSVVLDCGRGVVFDLLQGAISQPDKLLVEPEQRRRIMHSSPTVNMRIIQEALIGDGQRALPMPEIKVVGGSREEVIDL